MISFDGSTHLLFIHFARSLVQWHGDASVTRSHINILLFSNVTFIEGQELSPRLKVKCEVQRRSLIQTSVLLQACNVGCHDGDKTGPNWQ